MWQMVFRYALKGLVAVVQQHPELIGQLVSAIVEKKPPVTDVHGHAMHE